MEEKSVDGKICQKESASESAGEPKQEVCGLCRGKIEKKEMPLSAQEVKDDEFLRSVGVSISGRGLASLRSQEVDRRLLAIGLDIAQVRAVQGIRKEQLRRQRTHAYRMRQANK